MFLYELHSHTSEVSKCAQISAEGLVRAYKEMGFEGVCITNHFLNGNNTIDKALPWNEKIEAYVSGFEKAKRIGDEIGIKVMFGFEFSYFGADFLVYGIGKQWLLDNPDCMIWGILQFIDEVHRAGGFVVFAHPFRYPKQDSFYESIKNAVDGVEVKNSNCTDEENETANKFAEENKLYRTVGTDNHIGRTEEYHAIATHKKVEAITDLIALIKTGEYEIV